MSSAAGAKGHAIVNISTLSRITPATETLTSGFVISGDSPRDVLVRAVGPTLAAFGLNDALAKPQLRIFQGDREIATNRAWGANASAVVPLTGAFDRAGAFRLIEEDSNDAALMLTVAPGAYTVQVSSADPGAGGSVLLEVYDLP